MGSLGQGEQIIIRFEQGYVVLVKNNILILELIQNYHIQSVFTIPLQIMMGTTNIEEEVIGCNLSRWFDSQQQLIDYLMQNGHDTHIVKVNAKDASMQISIEAGRNRNKYIRVGVMQLMKVQVTEMMQLQFIARRCCSAHELTAQQIIEHTKILCAQLLSIQPDPKQMKEYSKQIQQYMGQASSKDSHMDMNSSECWHQRQGVCFQNHLQIQQLVTKLYSQMECLEQGLSASSNLIQQNISQYFQSLNARQNIQSYKLNYQHPQQPVLQLKPCKLFEQQEQPHHRALQQFKSVSFRQTLGINRIQQFVNTKAVYFYLFDTHQMQVQLRQNPLGKQPIMFTGTQKATIQTPIIKFSVRIKKMSQKISLGLVSSGLKNNLRCTFKDNLIKYCSNGNITCLQAKTHAGTRFEQGDTVTVFANIKMGIIYWATEKGKILYSQQNNIFRKQQITWIPYIQIIGEGDTLQWIVQ